MSLSRQFQFMLSEDENASIWRLQSDHTNERYLISPVCRNDQAHLRNVLKRLHDCYAKADPSQVPMVGQCCVPK